MTRVAAHRNTIAVTLGDPSGVGPEIVADSLRRAGPDAARRVVVYGDGGVLRGAIPEGVALHAVTSLAREDALPGKPTEAGARAQVAYLEAAVAAARAGEVAAIVTAPISKTQVRRAGFAFDGHTEYLAAGLGAARHAMMFAGPRLRVVLATVHVPLRDVPARIGAARIVDCVELAAESMARDFGIARPRVGVVGLNPHAGEGGLFGREEIDALAPAIQTCRARGIDARGPLVPDAAFRDAVDGAHDVLVALYHDQALIPVKLVDFEESVNVTLGLPIARTSPDHGVAYDIAGTGRARSTSFAAALRLADQMLARR
jgi:4-hydroxythreonine-4-phosphate dehydrogenase